MVILANMVGEALSSTLTSELLALLPSDSETAIYIHERLLGSVSPALQAAFRENRKESKFRVYKFLKDDDGFYTDVTNELLICFVRWAYIGDYSTELVGVSSFVEEQVAVEDVWDSWATQKRTVVGKKGKKCTKQNVLTEDILFAASEPEPISERNQIIIGKMAQGTDELETSGGASTETVFTLDPLFLHIQIYVFANIYLIDALKGVSERKIIEHLRKVENSPSKEAYTSKIFVLLEHASSYLTADDPLLNWLARYASWNLVALRQDVRRLGKLLGDGKFAELLLSHVVPSQRNPFT